MVSHNFGCQFGVEDIRDTTVLRVHVCSEHPVSETFSVFVSGIQRCGAPRRCAIFMVSNALWKHRVPRCARRARAWCVALRVCRGCATAVAFALS